MTCTKRTVLTVLCWALVWLAWIGLSVSGSAIAAPEFPTDTAHRGIVSFGVYQVFPENRPGNAVYLNNRLLLSLPGATITTLVELPRPGRFAYLAKKTDGGTILGVSLPRSDPAAKIKKYSNSFFHATMVIDGVVYKKLYRIVQDQILDLLPNSKTADGVTPGPAGLVFYHVSSVERVERNGRSVSMFNLRLHLALFEDERLRNLDYPIPNALPRLKLAWSDDATIEVNFAEGQVEMVSVSQFQ